MAAAEAVGMTVKTAWVLFWGVSCADVPRRAVGYYSLVYQRVFLPV